MLSIGVGDGLGDTAWLVRRLYFVLRNEGWESLGHLLAQSWRHTLSSLWSDRLFAIHVTSTEQSASEHPQAPFGGVEVHYILSGEEAERLTSQGYQDVRLVVRTARRRLRQGAVCIGVYVNREVAHVEWVSTHEKARRSVFPSPSFVDFAAREAAWGGAVTVHKYRGKGVFRYGMACALHFCRVRGYRVVVGATSIDNAPSIGGQTSLGPRVRALVACRSRLGRRKWTVMEESAVAPWRAEDDSICPCR